VLDGYAFLYPEDWSAVTVRRQLAQHNFIAFNIRWLICGMAAYDRIVVSSLRCQGVTSGTPYVLFALQTSGNDAFFRNPYNVEECLFVNITSPSSSSYDSVRSLGTPQQAAERLRQQYLSEFMSTRLGSRKKVDIISASSREANGRLYYDIEV
jgi:PsbP